MNLNVFTRISILTGALLCASCVSYEPAVLVPSLTLSAEDISLSQTSNNQSAVDFGIQISVNESDSLSNIEILPGVRVRSVSPNGAADSAGIQPGDIILSINGLETNHPDVLAILQQQGNNKFSVVLRRNTAVLEATLITRQLDSGEGLVDLYRSDPIATRAGYRTELLDIDGDIDLAAARVMELFPESTLPAAGIEIGDVVLSLNGTHINSAQDLISRLNREHKLGEEVIFEVFDGDNVSLKTVELWGPGRRISRVSLGPLLQYQSSLSPPGSNLSIFDFWLFAIYEFRRNDGERSHSFLGLFNVSTDYGELTEE